MFLCLENEKEIVNIILNLNITKDQQAYKGRKQTKAIVTDPKK